MKIELRNIGKLKNAVIEINSITVIAGKNDTGKSTVSKSLYSIFNGFLHIDKKIENEKNKITRYVFRLVELLIRNSNYPMSYIDDLTRKILDEISKIDTELLSEELKNIFEQNNLFFTNNEEKNRYSSIAREEDFLLRRILQVKNTGDDDFKKRIIQQQFKSEFAGQINNLHYGNDKGSIKLEIKNSCIDISIIKDEIFINKNDIDIEVKVPYIDSWSMVKALANDRGFESLRGNHSETLKDFIESKNKIDIVDKDSLKDILNILNSKNIGELIKKEFSGKMYRVNDIDLNLENVSAGIKTFIVIKTLILNGFIKDNGTIILDEPEIHLHPELQLVLAEILILLQKNFNLHILISTHSPYFLKAVEVYSLKYEIESCKYYLAKNIDKRSAIIEDVSDRTYEIYALLAKPFDNLNKLEEELV